jgi:hypothetical protein
LKTVAVLLVILFASLFVVTVPFEATANPTVFASMPKFQIESPKNNATLDSGNVEFEVTGQVMKRYCVNQSFPHFYCYLNGEEFIINATYAGNTSDGWLIFKGKTALTLLDGNYTFDVWQISCSEMARALNAETVKFTVKENNKENLQLFSALTIIALSLLALVAITFLMLRYKRLTRFR